MGDTKFGLLAMLTYVGAIGFLGWAVISFVESGRSFSRYRGPEAGLLLAVGISLFINGFIWHAIADAVSNHQAALEDIRSLLKTLTKKETEGASIE